MRRGVVIGKFYPPHRGHRFLIESALKACDDLVVLVCDHPDQNIRGEVRASWLKEMVPEASVRVIEDIYGADDSEAWGDYTIRLLGYAPDLVFTSESYGDAYAARMGAKHIQVDAARANVPISATQVRRDPLASWDYLDPCVRAHYAVRVCVIGAESTGTTTLAKELAEHFKTVWAPEYGRVYWEGKMASGTLRWESQEFVHIALQQNRLEDQLARICNKLLICDTNSLATHVWHERYMGFLSPEVASTFAGRKYDIYLVTDTDIPFVQDGTRDGEHIRIQMGRRFMDVLRDNGCRFELITGSKKDRLNRSAELCEELMRPLTGGGHQEKGLIS